MAKRKIKFTAYRIADISTAYVEKSDLGLLEQCPRHVAEVDGGYGSIIAVPLDETRATLAEMKDAGMSARFLTIMRELVKQRIPYVRFDADAADIGGLRRCKSQEMSCGGCDLDCDFCGEHQSDYKAKSRHIDEVHNGR